MSRVTIGSECKKCGSCVRVCPFGLYRQADSKSTPQIVQPEACVACGQCVAVCPSHALAHEAFPEGAVLDAAPETAASAAQIAELLRTRRSTRSFLDKPVPRELIESVLSAACYAGSGSNTQGTHYLVVQDKAVLKRISDSIFAMVSQWAAHLNGLGASAPVARRAQVNSLLEFGKREPHGFLHNAPVLLAFHADKADPFSMANANLAIANATLAATSLGLGCCYVGFVLAAATVDAGLPAVLRLPPKHALAGALVLGYPRVKFKRWVVRKPQEVRWL